MSGLYHQSDSGRLSLIWASVYVPTSFFISSLTALTSHLIQEEGGPFRKFQGKTLIGLGHANQKDPTRLHGMGKTQLSKRLVGASSRSNRSRGGWDAGQSETTGVHYTWVNAKGIIRN